MKILSKRLISFTILSAALSSHLQAQSVGGRDEVVFHWQGKHRWDALGDSVDHAGDSHGKDLKQFIIGANGYAAWTQAPAGSVRVFSYWPFLGTNTDVISIVNGSRIKLDIDFPSDAAGHDYKVLLSHTGTGPIFRGVEIPLSVDFSLRNSSNGIYPVSTHQGMYGTQDSNGRATARYEAPAGINPYLLGRTYWFAAIAIDANRVPIYSSMARPVTLKLF